MTIHLVLDCLDPGDGVSNDVRAQQAMFREMGYECEIYTAIYGEQMENVRRDINQLTCKKEDLLIHHYCGYSRVLPYVKKQSCKKVMIYHNITPPEFVEGDVKKDCEAGLQQVAHIGEIYDAIAGVSQFNLDCLAELGTLEKGRGDVLPIPVEFSGEKKEKEIRGVHEGTRFLFVGRYVPNKRLEDIIEAFVYFHDYLDPKARLRLVGNPNVMPNYTMLLRSRIDSKSCRDSIDLTGKVSDMELKKIYKDSDVFLCMSEHEGFCIPLLEAMWHGLAVFAYDAGAVRETMGNAGVVFTDKYPAATAEMIYAVLSDRKLIRTILKRQDQRIEDFSYKKVKDRLESLTEKWITGQIAPIRGESVSQRLMKIQMQGPFETSYSLALVNRYLIEAMYRQNLADVSIHCTEGPGDYIPAEKDLRDKPLARFLWKREKNFGIPDVAIRNMFPPVTTRLTAKLNFQAFGWEEDRVPKDYIQGFNKHLDGIGTMSDFVTKAMKDSGLTIPVKTMGIGVRLPDHFEKIHSYPLKSQKSIKFLHISSAFPRKGVDVLLNTFFQTFTNKDDVCLVLKTFPNIHNKTAEQLATLRKKFPNGPEVEHIDCDLPEDALYGLYKSASCYVHCARGEGFGLPVAEAMLAGLPTIVCNNSGLADFCTDETCLTVGFHKAPAHSHLTENSNWFEPDANKLAERMREFVLHGEEPYIAEKTCCAQNLIREKYTWEAVAQRWMSFIKEVSEETKRPTVDMVTTWNSKCGIAEFTRYFIENADRIADFRVFPDVGQTLIREDEPFVQKRVWKQAIENDHVWELIRALKQSPSEIVHVQYNLGFFSVAALSELCRELYKSKKVIVLFHATKAIPERIVRKDRKKIVDGLNTAFRLVVHQEADAAVLRELGILPEKISIIPHGQLSFPTRTVTEARKVLGISSDHVVGSYGFLLPHKGIQKTIEAVSLLKEKYPDILFIASCALYDIGESREYFRECLDTVRRLHLEKNVLLFTDFLAPEESAVLLQACNVTVMPYDPTNESASGAVRFCVAVNRPLITTEQKIFLEFEKCSFQIKDNRPKTIASAIEKMFDPRIAKKYIEKLQDQLERTSWHVVVREYQQLYLKAVNDGH